MECAVLLGKPRPGCRPPLCVTLPFQASRSLHPATLGVWGLTPSLVVMHWPHGADPCVFIRPTRTAPRAQSSMFNQCNLVFSVTDRGVTILRLRSFFSPDAGR